MENYLAQITIDFGMMADEHEGAAKNEHLWGLGAPDTETAEMHNENEMTHLYLTEIYRAISNNPKWFMDKLLAFGDQLSKNN
jgi:hypothetical protein